MSLPRYPEYKDSGVAWLGEVPGHWEVKRLKNLATIQNGSDYKHIQADSEGYPVIGSGGEFARAREYLYEGESVLLGRKGTIDRPLYINGAFWPVDTMFYTMIKQETCAKYLYYCALTIRFDLYSTSTALPSMTQADLSNIHFAVPDFEEQTAIANFLDRETAKIDALIAEQEKLIALLAEKRQATISRAVTKGLNPDAPMKDSGVAWLGEVPAHWEMKRLKHCLSLLTEKAETSTNKIALENIESWSGNYLPTESEFEGDGVAFAKGDILFGKLRPYLAKAYLAEFSGEAVGDFHVMRPSANVAPRFAQYQILNRDFIALVDGSTFGSKMPRASWEYVGNMPFPLPATSEQTAIAAFLDRETAKIDALTAEATRAIDLLKERRTALISAAVTGKIDVRTLA